jgi:hypothetical protein
MLVEGAGALRMACIWSWCSRAISSLAMFPPGKIATYIAIFLPSLSGGGDGYIVEFSQEKWLYSRGKSSYIVGFLIVISNLL